MKKFTAFLLISVLILSFASCSSSENSETEKADATAQSTESTRSDSPYSEEIKETAPEETEEVTTDEVTLLPEKEAFEELNYAKVIVDGNEIADPTYALVNKEKKTAEFAITSIMKALGATVTWDGDKVTIKKDGNELVFDTSLPDFGMPQAPGSANYVRSVVNEDIIIDRESANPFIRASGYSVKINYELGIINILPLS